MNRLYMLRSHKGCSTVPINPIVIIEMAATWSLKHCTRAYMTNMGRKSAAADIIICTLVSRPALVSFSFRWIRIRLGYLLRRLA